MVEATEQSELVQFSQSVEAVLVNLSNSEDEEPAGQAGRRRVPDPAGKKRSPARKPDRR